MKTAIGSGDKILFECSKERNLRGLIKTVSSQVKLFLGKKNPHSSGNAIQKGHVFLRRRDFHCRVKFTCVNEIEAISVKGHA